MKKIKFIFILVILIVFFKINIGYEKKHKGKSILEETKVKKTIHTFSLLDVLSRFAEDLVIG